MSITVLKVGGSLSESPEKLKALCVKLGELAKKHVLIVVPGGGEFADVVRDLDRRFSLSSAVAHRLAILGMDQYGLLLSDLTLNSLVADSLEDASDAKFGKLMVFLPSKLILNEDPLENSWDVTSDSIAAYIACRLDASQVLLVTDINGVYTSDPKKDADAKLIKKLTPKQLLDMNRRTSVDQYLPKILSKSKIKCFVVNGLFPERIEAILAGKEAVCTVISH
jgi:5-(aminomethyl)-3-furanmethanol phosphate kinase